MSHLNIQENYFEYIDSPEKAYWLGFIWADGTMRSGITGLKIGLQRDDKPHLKKFRDSVGGEFTISEYSENTVELSVTNPRFNRHLRKRGLKNNKSETEKLPKIIDELKPHFVRGFFGGDGSISEYKGKYHRFRISAKYSGRLELIYNWLSKNGISGGGVHSNGKKGYRLSITSKNDLKKIWNMIYPNGVETEPSLERKRNAFSEYEENW